MLVKDQLRMRMEQLGITPEELARRCEVSTQAVNYWVNGRNFPGKRQIPKLEKALSFKIDFSDGNIAPEQTSTLEQRDVEFLVKFAKLRPEFKTAIGHLVDSLLLAGSDAGEGGSDHHHTSIKHSPARQAVQRQAAAR
jgi:transcriptional regulator with XRE-family HTH domain